MREKKLPSLYLIPMIIITSCALLLSLLFAYVFVRFAPVSGGNERMSVSVDKTAAVTEAAVVEGITLSMPSYEDYGITLPETFTRTFSYASDAGFHGDKCTAVKYKTGGDESLFSDFTDGADTDAESQMNFVLESADVPENVHPDYSQSYRWKLLDNDDDRLVIIYFPDQETVYFGEAIM